MSALLVRLGQFQRVVRPTTSSVDQFIPMSTTGTKEETSNLVHFRLGGREHDFLPTISAFPHGALPSVNTIIAPANSARTEGDEDAYNRRFNCIRR